MIKISFFRAFELGKIRVISLRDLWLFIIAIILISMTTSAIGAFVAGIEPSNFFLGEERNVLVITEPGITTPMTGQIPRSLIDDIRKLQGIEAVSGEVLGVVVAKNLNNDPIVIRGINVTEFLKINTNVRIEGSWFNSEKTFSAVIGKTLAEEKGLRIGSKLQLTGTLAPVTTEVTISGIISIDNPIETELILPFSTAQALIGKSTGYVSFIRVRVNPTIISKSKLRDIVNGEYKVPIQVISRNPNYQDNLQGETISIFTPTGVLVDTQELSINGTASLVLPFGTYIFIVAPSFTDVSNISKPVFIYKSMTEPLVLEVGNPIHQLTVNVNYNNKPANNATVEVEEIFRRDIHYINQTFSNGSFLFENLTTSIYDIDVSFKGLSWNSRINLSDDTIVSVELKNYLNLTILNASDPGQSFNGGKIQLFSVDSESNDPINLNNTNNKILTYNSGDILYIDDPGLYEISYNYSTWQRSWVKNITGQISEKIYFGIGELVVSVVDDNGENLPGCTVEIVSINRNPAFSDSLVTNTNGQVKFNIDTGFQYQITLSHPLYGTKKYNSFYYDRWTHLSLTTQKIKNYFIDINLYNGSTWDKTPIEGAKITIYNNTFSQTLYSNSEGFLRLNVSSYGSYHINASYLDYSCQKDVSIGIDSEITTLSLPLGKVRLIIYTKTPVNIPIEESEILLINEKGKLTFNQTTDEDGKTEFLVPIGVWSVVINKMSYSNQKKLIFNNSQVYTFRSIFNLEGKMFFKVINPGGDPVSAVKVIIKNQLYQRTIAGLTDTTGEVLFENVPWGIYSVIVGINEDIQYNETIAFADETIYFTLKVDIPIDLLQDVDALTKWRGKVNISVVQSAQYLTEFLLTTLAVIDTTLSVLVMVVAALSVFSVSSVISHPISANRRALRMITSLGSSKKQVNFIVQAQMILTGMISSIVGSVIGTIIMVHDGTIVPNPFRVVNIGGLVIKPEMDIQLIMAITTGIVLIVFLKTKQAVDWFVYRKIMDLESKNLLYQEALQRGFIPREKKVMAILSNQEELKKAFKQRRGLLPFLIVTTVVLLIHFPIIPNISGYDGFLALWQGQQVFQGNITPWTIHPLSIFGLFSYSGYPIGGPLVIAFLLTITNGDIVTTTHLFVAIFCIGSSYTSTKMIKEFTSEKWEIIVGGIIYNSFPILLRFTYFSTTTRALIMIVVPLLIIYLNRWRKDPALTTFGKIILVLLIMFLLHRMALAFSLLVVMTMIFVAWITTWKNYSDQMRNDLKKSITLHIRALILIVWPILYIYSLYKPIVPTNFIDYPDIGITNTELKTIINEIIDFGMAWGLIVFFVIIALIATLQKIKEEEQPEKYLDAYFLLFIMTPFIMALNSPTYLSFILIPFITIMGTRGVHIVTHNNNLRQIYSYFNGLFIIGLWIFIYIFLRSIMITLIIVIIVSCLLFLLPPLVRILTRFNYLNKKKTPKIFIVGFVVLLLVHSFLLVQVRLTTRSEDDFPLKYISDDEIAIANYLKNHGTGFFSAYHAKDVQIRIAAASGWYCFEQSDQSLVDSGIIPKETIIPNSTLKPFDEWFENYIFEYNGSDYIFRESHRIWNVLLHEWIASSRSKMILNRTKLSYFVTYGYNTTAYGFWGEHFESNFIKSLQTERYTTKVFETERLILWQINLTALLYS